MSNQLERGKGRNRELESGLGRNRGTTQAEKDRKYLNPLKDLNPLI